MPLDKTAITDAENRKHSEQLEQAMVIMATVLLRKTGRRRVMITNEDIRQAHLEGLAEVRNPAGDPNQVTYELPKKRK